MLPPECSSLCWDRNGWRWVVGVVEGRWKVRENEGKTAWLFIGILSRADWIGGVITDDELAVLIICACSSRNLLKKHHFTSSHLHIINWVKGYAYLACCPRRGLQIALLREQTLLRQWGSTEKAPAGADTTAVVGKYRELLREQTLLRQWGSTEKAPAGADTTAVVGKYR